MELIDFVKPIDILAAADTDAYFKQSKLCLSLATPMGHYSTGADQSIHTCKYDILYHSTVLCSWVQNTGDLAQFACPGLSPNTSTAEQAKVRSSWQTKLNSCLYMHGPMQQAVSRRMAKLGRRELFDKQCKNLSKCIFKAAYCCLSDYCPSRMTCQRN